jgi:VanZ family protein
MRSGFFSFDKIKLSFFPAIVWFILSVILLTLPGSSFPKENWFDKIWLDKWVHIGLFAIMVTLWCWALRNKNPVGARLKNFFIWIGLLCLVYGIGMEFVQKYFISNRSFDVGDIIADGIGCSLGVFYCFRRYIKK